MKITTLICTVGTSLFYPNLCNLDPFKYYKKVCNTRNGNWGDDKESLSAYGLFQDRRKLEIVLESTKKFYDSKNWPQLAKQLVMLPPDIRLCGAEINSVEAMIRKKFLGAERNRLILLVSDTDDGNAIGSILKAYFEDGKCPIQFKSCEYEVVAGLQDKKPLAFRTEGLINLVRILGKELKKWGRDCLGINATGGYKAQIALAVAFGQATHCPVFYKHERFDQIIRFSQVPFTLDLSMIENNLKLWADLVESSSMLERDEIDARLTGNNEMKEAIYPLLDDVEIDGKIYFELSALGMVYWEAFLINNPDVTIKPTDVINRQGCHFRDDNYPIGFKEYVEKVYNAFPSLISECHSLPYSGQKGITMNRFYIKDSRIMGEYIDKDAFGSRFEIMTAATNELERKWVCGELEKGVA
jgi:putative CRISPR-associated protein (TIGR02619 family)